MKCIAKRTKRNGNGLLASFPCGKCLPCMITKRQALTARLLLEMKSHLHIYFVTLTYSDMDLPPGGSLQKRDLQLFLKRLRKNTGLKFKYFACGEYGEKFQRPHYHILIFTDTEIPVQFSRKKASKEEFISGSPFHDNWFASSMVDVRYLLSSADFRRVAAYVCGYILKN